MLFNLWSLIATLLLFSSQRANAQTNLTEVLESIVDCGACLLAIVPLQGLALLGDDIFSDAFVEVCDAAKLEDPDVCSGLFGLLGPIIAHDVLSIDAVSTTAERLCDALFGFCANKTPQPFTVPLQPPSSPPSPPVAPNPRNRPFTVVHISDVHIDRNYTVGSEANCTKNICCRNYPDEAGEPILEAAQPFGNHQCDSPVDLADSLLEAVNSFNPEFVIFTGDVVEGDIWETTQEGVTTDLTDFNAEMLSKITATIYPAIGNHDSNPVNSFPRNTTNPADNVQWVFDTQSAGWEHWLGSNASEQVDHMSGSYAISVPDRNLMIISVNTQYWYRQNLWLYDSNTFQPDPNGIFAFMADQLQAAEDKGQLVWIMGHIPLGKPDTIEDQSNYYNQILQRYKDTIVGQFFGHSHKDQFEIAYSDYDNQIAANAVGVGIICPALTPTSGNPAFKVYEVDPDTFGIMNMRIIFTNVSDPTFQKKPTWSVYYDVREVYGTLVGLPETSELTPAFWHNLTEVFAANETAFQLFNTHISRGGAVTPCDDTDDCRNNTICDMRAFRSQNNCDVDAGGFTLRRRSASGGSSQGQDASECEGTGIREVLAKIQSNLWARRK
ncbi:Metallo-dependent phosphatase-like protein [Rhodocollybia butyracea]|uniref:Sphingomyelin phosphodiesterase n=1 Tax=Rhodocollybia butyracea TaxID=206335 RepID=A0A9P5UGQ4_9AGAR|nr:Metallo-dependent phosphatase-like protein [Rhodocollybia butyracea]